MSNGTEKKRIEIQTHYTNALQHGSCCGPSAPAGVLAETAGYTAEDLKAIADGTKVTSFGCGNPLAFAGVREGDVVLDLGSGAGFDLLIAAQKVGRTGSVIGIDMTDAMLDRARANIRAAGLETVVEVRKGVIEELPVESASVDWVISNCVINLSPEKPRVFAEIARVLKPGGRISISDIVVQDLPDWVRENAALYSSCVGGAISEEEYLAGLRNSGLADVSVTERLVYDVGTLVGLVESELPQAQAAASCGCGCGGSGLPKEQLAQVAKEMKGKIWSAKFTGRKP
ncbi:MAG: methyltransferase domain-containing protein [Myxococcales bacterium]|nr:MAG: methyltransferase domain-containing protein [Myxococcales bacterium]